MKDNNEKSNRERIRKGQADFHALKAQWLKEIDQELDKEREEREHYNNGEEQKLNIEWEEIEEE